MRCWTRTGSLRPEKVKWTKTEVLSAYKKAVAVGQFKRVVYRKYPFMYNKYDLIIPRSKLLQMKYWVLAHPGENYEFWVGHGETFKLKAQALPLKYIEHQGGVRLRRTSRRPRMSRTGAPHLWCI